MHLLRSLTLLAALGATALAGGLSLTITPGAPGSWLTAKVTACHEPAKSLVTASVVTVTDGGLQRRPLTVSAVPGQLGVFAISGALPEDNVVIELAVTNPQFDDYQPRVLLRAEGRKIRMATKKYFFKGSPKVADYRQVLQSYAKLTD